MCALTCCSTSLLTICYLPCCLLPVQLHVEFKNQLEQAFMASERQFPGDQAELDQAVASVHRAALVKREELACFVLRHLAPLIQMMQDKELVH